MAFKVACLVLAPDADPNNHRALIQTSKVHLTGIMVRDSQQAVQVARELSRNERVHEIMLCAGFTHQAMSAIVEALEQKVTVSVARSDIPGVQMLTEALSKEGLA